MARLVKYHPDGCWVMVGRMTKAQEAEFYKQLGDGPRSWFRREPPARTATPDTPPDVATSRDGEPLPSQDESGPSPAGDGPASREKPRADG